MNLDSMAVEYIDPLFSITLLHFPYTVHVVVYVLRPLYWYRCERSVPIILQSAVVLLYPPYWGGNKTRFKKSLCVYRPAASLTMEYIDST